MTGRARMKRLAGMGVSEGVAIGRAVVAAWRKYFGLEMDYLGYIGYDDEMWRAVRARRPLLVERCQSRAVRFRRAG